MGRGNALRDALQDVAEPSARRRPVLKLQISTEEVSEDESDWSNADTLAASIAGNASNAALLLLGVDLSDEES